MGWVLIIIIAAGSLSVTSTTADFDTKAACVDAARLVEKTAKEEVTYLASVTTVCASKTEETSREQTQ